MSPYDDFVHVSTGPAPRPSGSNKPESVPDAYFKNSRGERQNTLGLLVDSIRKHHPEYHLSVVGGYSIDLIGFAKSRGVPYFPHGDASQTIIQRIFSPPARRYNDESGGLFFDDIVFACYDYSHKGTDFLVYIATGADGQFPMKYNYILTKELAKGDGYAQKKSDELIADATKWMQELHNEVLVFDQGYWQKSPELWQNIQKASWEDVILEKDKKAAIIDDIVGFFSGQDRYEEFGVPWKRGVIFYGPPGNGKTISTKALMHDISKKADPKIESLYVKTFNSYMGPEYGIRQIFLKAREMAPCLLIFEDIDSLVSPMVRSYFLNEVDGLESNHGILMIGSTNHLDRLDPGIAKRPSRFDRKYFFDVPTKDERIQYCEYWRHKLRNNKKVEFPEEMSVRVADLTTDFSFAYMKEAFVAALLVIVARSDAQFMVREDDLSGNILWRELKKQIESLRKEMDGDDEDAVGVKIPSLWEGQLSPPSPPAQFAQALPSMRGERDQRGDDELDTLLRGRWRGDMDGLMDEMRMTTISRPRRDVQNDLRNRRLNYTH